MVVIEVVSTKFSLISRVLNFAILKKLIAKLSTEIKWDRRQFFKSKKTQQNYVWKQLNTTQLLYSKLLDFVAIVIVNNLWWSGDGRDHIETRRNYMAAVTFH